MTAIRFKPDAALSDNIADLRKQIENAARLDLKAVFAKLKSVGFNGPIMVEGVQVGATAAETTANARANRELLEKTLASI